MRGTWGTHLQGLCLLLTAAGAPAEGGALSIDGILGGAQVGKQALALAGEDFVCGAEG